HTKQVRDYAGRMIGMPNEIAQLESAVDAAAGTDKWVEGTPDNFATLKEEHWDFRATDDDHLALLDTAVPRRGSVLLTKLIGAGVSARSWFGCMALARAAEDRNWTMIKALISAHAPMIRKALPTQIPMDCNVLEWAAQGKNSPRFVEAVLKLRPD